MKKYAIYYLLVLTFIVRIYNIMSPLIGNHSWRQTDTAAIARNYYENGYKFSYPQIDWGGNSPGYVETEFPIYPFVVALLYKLCGVYESIGRFLSIVFSIITNYFLYLLVRKVIDEITALWSCFLFAILPSLVFFGRAFMPESAILMSSILGIYFFLKWADSESWQDFLLSSGFITLACLLKIPTLYLGLPLLYIACLKFKTRVLFQWSLWLYSFVVLIPVIAWYYHAHQLLLHQGFTFGIWEYGTDKWGNWDLIISLKYWSRILFTRIANRHLQIAGFFIFIWGLLLKRNTPHEKLFDFWLLSILVYFIIVGKGNYVHDYYQLPIIIPAIVFIGKVYTRYYTIGKSAIHTRNGIILTLCLVCIIVLSTLRYSSLMKEENPRFSTQFILGQYIQQKIEKNALIIAVDNNDPTILYLSHRKGWHAFPDGINQSFLEERIQTGAQYIVGINSDFKNELQKQLLNAMFKKHSTVFNNGVFFVTKL